MIWFLLLSINRVALFFFPFLGLKVYEDDEGDEDEEEIEAR